MLTKERLLVFLALNGYEVRCDSQELADQVVKVAASEIDRHIFSTWLKKHLSPLPL